jgi:hypothetical protein
MESSPIEGNLAYAVYHFQDRLNSVELGTFETAEERDLFVMALRSLFATFGHHEVEVVGAGEV